MYACGGRWVGEGLDNADDDICGEHYSVCKSINHDEYQYDCTDAIAFPPNYFYASNATSYCANVTGILGCGSSTDDGWLQFEDDCGSNAAVLNVETSDNSAHYGWVFVNTDLDSLMHRNSSIGGLLCCRDPVNTDETDNSLDDLTAPGSMGTSIKQMNAFVLLGILMFAFV